MLSAASSGLSSLQPKDRHISLQAKGKANQMGSKCLWSSNAQPESKEGSEIRSQARGNEGTRTREQQWMGSENPDSQEDTASDFSSSFPYASPL